MFIPLHVFAAQAEQHGAAVDFLGLAAGYRAGGVTAAQALFGKQVLVTRDHGRLIADNRVPFAMATTQPSAILRTETDEQRQHGR